jgi:microcystin-dependent protein
MDSIRNLINLVFQTRAQVERLNRQVEGFLNPVGAIQLWTGASNNIPAGWLNCDGSSVLISAYPELYAVIGTSYGQVDLLHFNLPNFVGKFAIGVSPTNLIGSSGGSKTITQDQLPAHNHPNTSESTGISVTATDSGHTHTVTAVPSRSFISLAGTTTWLPNEETPITSSVGVANITTNVSDPTHTHTSGTVGLGQDYLQPYTSVFYTICYTAKFPTS